MPKTILLVDDDAFFRVQVQDALAAESFRFVEAANGLEALAAVDTQRPDLMLLDLLMPDHSGIEALPELRRRCPDVPIIVVSSLDSPSLMDQAMCSGASCFLVKPFHPVEIGDAVRQFLPR